MRRIQVLGPGCARCAQLAEKAEAAAQQLGLACAVERVTNIDEIIDLGVLMTPALVVDGEVKVVGIVPSTDEIKEMLMEPA